MAEAVSEVRRLDPAAVLGLSALFLRSAWRFAAGVTWPAREARPPKWPRVGAVAAIAGTSALTGRFSGGGPVEREIAGEDAAARPLRCDAD